MSLHFLNPAPAVIFAGLISITACGPMQPATLTSVNQSLSAAHFVVSQVGWSTTPINIASDSTYAAPLGYANSPISGTTLSAFVISPSTTVRADGNSCVSCHGGPGSLRPEWNASALTRDQFCALVPSFEAANKPAVLKAVLAKWLQDGCPN